LSEDDDLRTPRDFFRLEGAADLDIPVARFEPAGIDAEHGARPVDTASHDLSGAAHIGRRHLHARHFSHDRCSVVIGQR
jgi:hypothetical protein